MDPLLSWVVSGLSAFLLGTGGYLLARALLAPRLMAQGQLARQLQAQVAELTRANQALREELVRRDAERARGLEAAAPPPGHFEEESTMLPDPVGYFNRLPDRPSVPRLQRVSENEYEIGAAAPPGVGESLEGDGDTRDATRQFKLHSPEAVVHFLQRIDELTDENRELKAALKERESLIKEQKVEGSEHVQRFAALDTTVDKLRQELKRKSARIKQLEERLEGEIRAAPPPRPAPKAGGAPPPPPSPLDTAVASRPTGGSATFLDAPTLEVHRIDERELRKGLGEKK